ncbi:hypothetical protein SEPCBS57363_003617 [Sporothrix epigloea]|uniref:DUF7907 domain-containing protein n=1 Tax=Sporothrix epigloea TaxID=1892477 RepID=A0ABP0DMP2_9PEZI
MLNNLSLFLALSASALVSASPIANISTKVSSPPESSTSQGFRLVARTTDPFSSLSEAVEGTVLEALHVGSSDRIPILQKPDAQNPGRVFYFDRPPQNEHLSLLTDSSASIGGRSGPVVSYGFSVQPPTDSTHENDNEQNVLLQVGGASRSTPVSLATILIPSRGIFLLNDQGYGTFMACNRSIPYYNQETMITVEYFYASDSSTDADDKFMVPEACVPIRLVPICADLPALPPGSPASHEYVHPASCYINMSGSL